MANFIEMVNGIYSNKAKKYESCKTGDLYFFDDFHGDIRKKSQSYISAVTLDLTTVNDEYRVVSKS